jgi:alpha-tubulin suppressor-like RCC1 family protein
LEVTVERENGKPIHYGKRAAILRQFRLEPDGARFDTPLTLTLDYDPAWLAELGILEDALDVYGYSPATQSWQPVGGTVDPASHHVSARIGHFSTWALGARVTANPAVRILVAYTPAAQTATADIAADIAAAVDLTNQSFINSSVSVRVELAASVPVSYSESADMVTDLHRLDGSLAGTPAIVHLRKLRDDHAADLVVLVVDTMRYTDPSGGPSGMTDMDVVGDTVIPTPGHAFAVVKVAGLASPNTEAFRHELGHLFGVPHSAGYYHAGRAFRTLMAYDLDPSLCPMCMRINNWSNPEISYLGTPTGSGTHNAAAIIRSNAPRLESYRRGPAMSAGRSHTLFSRSDGSVWAAGKNEEGQLGDGTTFVTTFASGSGRALDGRDTVSRVAGLANVVAVCAGDDMSLALKDDGTLWAWGRNGLGNLETGDTNSATVPRKVRIDSVIDIPSTGDCSMAVRADGSVWWWGKPRNVSGPSPRSDLATTPVPLPSELGRLPPVRDLEASSGSYYALDRTGRVWGWGSNARGQLGFQPEGSEAIAFSTARFVPGLSSIVAISSGRLHLLALDADGTVWQSGLQYWMDVTAFNDRTKKVDNYRVIAPPAQVPGLSDVVSVAAGHDSSMAVTADGKLWTWGGPYGVSGPPQGTHDFTVPWPMSYVFSPSIGVASAVAYGYETAIIVDDRGQYWSCGDNAFGQLGDGYRQLAFSPYAGRQSPVRVALETWPQVLK